MKVRIYCHVGSSTGYARASTDLCFALIRAGVDLEIRTLTDPTILTFSEAELPIAARVKVEDAYKAPADRTLSNHPDVVIVHTMPMSCASTFELGRLRDLPSKPVCIAYTTWEAESTPREVLEGIGKFDQVWVPSTSNLLAFQAYNEFPEQIRVLPHCVREDEFEETYVTPARPDFTKRPYTFYFIGAWTTRKDPESVLRAYGHAFTKADNVALRFHSRLVTKERLFEAIASLGLPMDVMPVIQPSNRELDQEEIWNIHRNGDCFVSASHGEAWNLPAFDAMLFGNHVIVPKGQGTDDFLDGTSADFIPCGLAPARNAATVQSIDPVTGKANMQTQGAEASSCKLLWLEPDLVELSRLMRRAYEAKTRNLRIGYDPLQRYGLGPVGTRAVQYIEQALAARSTR